MHTTLLLKLAKAILLVAFFLANPKIVGTVYAGYIVFHITSKSINNLFDRYVAMGIASLFVGLIAPLFFQHYPGVLFGIAFAAVLTWVFTPTDVIAQEESDVDSRPLTGGSDEIIDVEVISVETIEH